MMSAVDFFKYIHLAHFTKPASDRAIYRLIRRRRPRSIVEIGIGDAVRAQRMIRQCTASLRTDHFRYTGIDLFEARSPSDPGITIKLAHKLLKPLATKVQLIPGDPHAALTRAANSLTQSELILIRADQDAESMQRAWFYLPRMLSERSVVLMERKDASGKVTIDPLTLSEITKLADQQRTRRKAA